MRFEAPIEITPTARRAEKEQKQEREQKRYHRYLRERFGFLCSEHPLVIGLTQRIHALAKELGAPVDHVYVINSPEINAFVMRGQRDVYLYRGVLRSIQEWLTRKGLPLTEGSLDMIPGHEIAHLLQHTQLPEKTTAEEQPSPEKSDSSEELAERRRLEFDADRRGLLALAHTGSNPREGLHTIEMLHAISKHSSFGASHPRSIDRVRELTLLVESPDTLLPNIDAAPTHVDAASLETIRALPERPGTRLYERRAHKELPDLMRETENIFDALEVVNAGLWHERNRIIDRLVGDPRAQSIYAKMIFLENIISTMNAILASQKKDLWVDHHHGRRDPRSAVQLVRASDPESRFLHQEATHAGTTPAAPTASAEVLAETVLDWLQDEFTKKENGVIDFLQRLGHAGATLSLDERQDGPREARPFEIHADDESEYTEQEEENMPRSSRKKSRTQKKKQEKTDPFLPSSDSLIGLYAKDLLTDYRSVLATIDHTTLDRFCDDIDTRSFQEKWSRRSSVHQAVLRRSARTLLEECATDGNPFFQEVISDQEGISSRRHAGTVHTETVVEWPYLDSVPMDAFGDVAERRQTLDHLLRKTIGKLYQERTRRVQRDVKRALWDESRFGEASQEQHDQCLRLPEELITAFGHRLAQHYVGHPSGVILSTPYSKELGVGVAHVMNEASLASQDELEDILNRIPPEECSRLLDFVISPIYPVGCSAHPRFLGDVSPALERHLEERFQLVQGLIARLLQKRLASQEGGWTHEREKSFARRLTHAIDASTGNTDATWQHDVLIKSLARQNPQHAGEVYQTIRLALDALPQTWRDHKETFLLQALTELSPSLPLDEQVNLLALFEMPDVLATFVIKLHEDEFAWKNIPLSGRAKIITLFFTHVSDHDISSLDRDQEGSEKEREERKIRLGIEQLFSDTGEARYHGSGWYFEGLKRELTEEYLEILSEDSQDPTEALTAILGKNLNTCFAWESIRRPLDRYTPTPRSWVWDRALPPTTKRALRQQVQAEERSGRNYPFYDGGTYLHGEYLPPQHLNDAECFLAVLVERAIAEENGQDYTRFEFIEKSFMAGATLFGETLPTPEPPPPLFDTKNKTLQDNVRFITAHVPMRLRDDYLGRCMEAYGYKNRPDAWFDERVYPGGMARLLSPLKANYDSGSEYRTSSAMSRLGYIGVAEAAKNYRADRPSIFTKTRGEDFLQALRADLLTKKLKSFRYHETGDTSPQGLLDGFFALIPEKTDFRDSYLLRFEEQMRTATIAHATPERWRALLEVQQRIVHALQNPDDQLQMGRRAQETYEQHVMRPDAPLEEQLASITHHFPHATHVRDTYLRRLSDSPLVATPQQLRRVQTLTVAEDRHRIGDVAVHQEQKHFERLSELCAILSTEERKDFVLWLLGETRVPPLTFRALGASLDRSVEDVPKIIAQATPEERQQLLLRVCLGPHGLLEPAEGEETGVLQEFIEKLGSKLFREMPKDMGKKGKQMLRILLDTALTAHQPIRRFLILNALLEAMHHTEDDRFETRVRVLLEALGPAFVKAAQVLSEEETADGEPLLPPSLQNALRTLKEQVSTFHRGAALEIAHTEGEFDHDLGKDRLVSLDDCLAAASMKQVYTGTTAEGTQVVEKFLRPSIGKQNEQDIAVLHIMATRLGTVIEIPPGVVSRIERWVREEADLSQEVRNQSDMRAVLGAYAVRQQSQATLSTHRVFAPAILRASARHIREEYVRGTSLEDLARRPDGATMINSYYLQALDALFYQTFVIGVFHADPHAGNLLVTDEGEIAFIDLGNVGRIEEERMAALRQFFLGTLFGDGDSVDTSLAAFAIGLAPETRSAIRQQAKDTHLSPPERFHRIAALLSTGTHQLHPGFEKFMKMLVTSSYLMRGIPPETLGPLVMNYLQS